MVKYNDLNIFSRMLNSILLKSTFYCAILPFESILCYLFFDFDLNLCIVFSKIILVYVNVSQVKLIIYGLYCKYINMLMLYSRYFNMSVKNRSGALFFTRITCHFSLSFFIQNNLFNIIYML